MNIKVTEGDNEINIDRVDVGVYQFSAISHAGKGCLLANEVFFNRDDAFDRLAQFLKDEYAGA